MDKDTVQCRGWECTNDGVADHVCPLGAEIHDDKTECNCCDSCSQGCADDI